MASGAEKGEGQGQQRHPKSLERGLQFLVYAGFRLLEGLLKITPLAICAQLGRFTGLIAWLTLPGYRTLVGRNLAIAFGDEGDERTRRQLIRRSFTTTGLNVFAGLKLGLMPAAKVEARVRYENRNHWEEARRQQDRGIITALSHLGNWELLTQLPSLGDGIAAAAMYRPLSNPFLNRHIARRRSQSGVTLFDRSAGLYGPMRHLRQGGAIGILIDQHAGAHGIWCPFFNRLASTTNLPALLARKTGALIVPIAVIPEPGLRWKVVYQPAIDIRDLEADHEDPAAAVTLRLNRGLEEVVRRQPEQWFWFHHRWRTPKPHFLLARSRRGVYLGDQAAESLKPFRLLVRSPNPLGDACMAIPAIRALKAARPDLQLVILCRQNLEPLWRRVDAVDEVIAFPKGAKPWQVGRQVRKAQRPCDAAMLLPHSLRVALEARFAGIPHVVGYHGHGRRWLLHQAVPMVRRQGRILHHAREYLELAEHCGADSVPPWPLKTALCQINPTVVASKGSNGASPSRVIGICPGAEYGNSKRWPVARYAEVARGLFQDEPATELVILGSPAEGGLARELERELRPVPCRNLAGRTDLDQLMDQLAACDLVLCNDTGTMHLAAALGRPTVAIFGSTEPAWTAPLGEGHRVIRRHVECSPCFLRECPLDFRCMTEVEPEQVLAAAREQLASGVA